MKITTIILIIAMTVLVNGQFTCAEENYIESEDQFINNNNGWDEYNMTMGKALVDGGQYHIENKSVGGELFVLHHADFPLGREFIIETSIKPVNLSKNYAYGFIMGASDASNGYVFQVMPGNMYAIIQIDKGNPKKIAGGKIKSRNFKPDDFNSFKIEKMGGTVRFYISDYFLEELTDVKLFGKKIGFFIDGKAEIAIDYTRSEIWLD